MKSLRRFKRSQTGSPPLLPFIVATTVGLAMLLFLLLATTPDRIGPIGITGFFIILLLTFISFGLTIRNGLLNQPRSTSLLFIIILAVSLTGSLALNTIKLGVGDVVLLTLFVITFTIYWTKLR